MRALMNRVLTLPRRWIAAMTAAIKRRMTVYENRIDLCVLLSAHPGHWQLRYRKDNRLEVWRPVRVTLTWRNPLTILVMVVIGALYPLMVGIPLLAISKKNGIRSLAYTGRVTVWAKNFTGRERSFLFCKKWEPTVTEDGSYELRNQATGEVMACVPLKGRSS